MINQTLTADPVLDGNGNPIPTITPALYAAWLNDPDAIRNVLVEAVASVNGTDQTFYLSILQYASRATDLPANQPYRAVLIRDDIETTEQLSVDGSATLTIGDVGVDNKNGEFDPWLGYIWTNRPIKILFGDVRWPRANYQPVHVGVTADVGNKSRDSINLKVRDNIERLNAAITERLLGGTGANQASTLPLVFGEVVNVTPLLIDPTTLQYQVHDGAINGLIEIRDNGVPIANDTIGWAAVILDAGHGTFRLASTPAGAVTCSLQGDAGGSAGYVSTVAGIVQRIVTGYGYSGNRFTLSEIDTANFTAFDNAHQQPVGISVTNSANTISVIQQVTAALKAQLTTSRTGLLQLKQIDFANLTPTFDITTQHMNEHTLYPTDRTFPQGAVWLTFCQNQTPQPNLQTSLPAEAVALMGKQNLDVKAVDISAKILYKLTDEPTQEDTLLLRRSDALAEAQRRLNNRKVPRATYQFEGYTTLFQLTLGQAVRLFHPRFNLAAGTTGLVISMATKWGTGRTTVGVMA